MGGWVCVRESCVIGDRKMNAVLDVTLAWIGVTFNRRIGCQVSRFDITWLCVQPQHAYSHFNIPGILYSIKSTGSDLEFSLVRSLMNFVCSVMSEYESLFRGSTCLESQWFPHS